MGGESSFFFFLAEEELMFVFRLSAVFRERLRSKTFLTLFSLLLFQVEYCQILRRDLGDAHFSTMNRAFNRKKGEQK